ncbi:hypothetical protein ACIQPR_46245 [Streptomyces sp. NPDC091280]|uniref:hypothetical protein n=1 Tax=Streptomyces sp. NPDC091280 TaxID=3365984 RepID=UPI0037FB6024
MRLRIPLIATLLATTTFAAAPLGQTAAAADDYDTVACKSGNLTITFAHAFTTARQPVKVSGTGAVNRCLHFGDEPTPITSGTLKIEGAVPAACHQPIGPGNVKVTVTWNTGTRTAIDDVTFRSTGNHAATAQLDGGRISDGPFKGGVLGVDLTNSGFSGLLLTSCSLNDSDAQEYTVTINRFAVGDAEFSI